MATVSNLFLIFIRFLFSCNCWPYIFQQSRNIPRMSLLLFELPKCSCGVAIYVYWLICTMNNVAHSVQLTQLSMSVWKNTGRCSHDCVANGGKCCSLVQCDFVCFSCYLVSNNCQWHSYEMSSVSLNSHTIGFSDML